MHLNHIFEKVKEKYVLKIFRISSQKSTQHWFGKKPTHSIINSDSISIKILHPLEPYLVLKVTATLKKL